MFLTYDALGIKLTGTLEGCDGCARYKSKERAVRKIKYTQETNTGKRIFVDTTDPFPKILIKNRYWIVAVEDYIHYSWLLFTTTKSQLPRKTQ